jgi:ribonuclease III
LARADEQAATGRAEQTHHEPGGAALPSRPLSDLESAIGYEFTDKECLQNALIHKSYLHAVPDFYLGSNERLEFLGDAVLGLIVSGDLYLSHPGVPEGHLSALRGALVRKDTLARLAERIELGEYLYLSRGEEVAGGRTRPSNLARAAEALLGAVYLDGGLEAASHVWHSIRGEESDEQLQEVLRGDYKSRLQQLTQAELKLTPSYRLAGASGPEHAKEFVVEAVLGDRVVASGTGRSKQLAEQAAAEAALQIISEETRGEDGEQRA